MIEEISKVLREGFTVIRDVSAGRYSSERGTSAMSVDVLNPVAEILSKLDAENAVSISEARVSLRRLCEAEHLVMSNYKAIMRFAFNGDIPSTASH